MASITYRESVVKEAFSMKLNYQFKIDCYNFKMFYVILMETIKKISIEWTWKDVQKGIKNTKKWTKKKNLARKEVKKKLWHEENNE